MIGGLGASSSLCGLFELPIRRMFEGSVCWIAFGVAVPLPSLASEVSLTDLLHREQTAMEKTLGKSLEDEYVPRRALLNTIVTDVLEQLDSVGEPVDSQSIASVIQKLTTVAETLREHGFRLEPTVSVTDALTPKKLGGRDDGEHIQLVPVSPNHPNVVYGIDCDIAAFVYLEVGRIANWPIGIVEAKEHNFLRWYFDNGAYINWDPNAVGVFSDDDYRAGKVPTLPGGFTEIEEENRRYLSAWNDREILAYHNEIIALMLIQKGDERSAVPHLELAVRERPHSASAKNNLAWVLAVSPHGRNPSRYSDALGLAKSAVELAPAKTEYRDTLACVFASMGKFDDASRELQYFAASPARLRDIGAGRRCSE